MGSSAAAPLKRHQKVVAAVDLTGVPAGTPGRIQMVNGFSWVRYRVRFANGEELGFLGRDDLVPAKDWEGAA